MKKLLLFSLVLLSGFAVFAQAGKYAGSKKSMIGKIYTDSRNIPGLKGWTFMEGALLNQVTDPEYIMADVYKKGTVFVVVFSIREDTASELTTIYDVIEITGVTKGWGIRVGTCSRLAQADPYIVSWGKETQDEYMKLFKKAWRFNPDKRRVEAIPVKGIKCENIGC
jgi:hypothetical protein